MILYYFFIGLKPLVSYFLTVIIEVIFASIFDLNVLCDLFEVVAEFSLS